MQQPSRPDHRLTLPLEPESARRAGDLARDAAASASLSGRPLLRLLQAVEELAESTALLARTLDVKGDFQITALPYTGWLTVEMTFPREIPLDPVFDQQDSVLEELPGLKVMPDIFWRRIIMECVDKAEWVQSPRRITVRLTQYARPENRPGELYFLGLTPRPAPDLALEFVADDLAVAVAPSSKAAFRLPPKTAFVLQAVDGETPVRDIYSAYVARFGMAHPATVGRIVEDLDKRGLIITGDPLTEGPQSGWDRLRSFAGRVLSFQYSLPAPDRWVGAINRHIGGLWSPAAALLLLAASALAMTLTLPGATLRFESMSRSAMLSSVFAAPLPAAFFITGLNLALLMHELAHALVCKRLGGRIHAFGLMVYCGVLCPFVDTTDAWMFKSKWHRVAVSLAGPASDIVCAGLIVSLATLFSSLGFAAAAEALAALALFLVIMSARNLIPLLQVDGYYALSDMLEVPNLRPRSFAATKGLLLALVGFGGRKVSTFRGEWLFIAYGAACMGGILMLVLIPAGTMLLDNLSALRGPLAWVLSAVFAVWALHFLADSGRDWYRRTRLRTLDLKAANS